MPVECCSGSWEGGPHQPCLLRVGHGKEFTKLESVVVSIADLPSDPLLHVQDGVIEALPE